MVKIIKDSDIDKISQEELVLVGGCFDVIHPAHLEFLRRAKKLGKMLVVLLESDQNISNLKGKNRPVNNQNVRAENLSKIMDIDYIVLLRTPDNSKYYYNLVKLLKPDIIAVTEKDKRLKDKIKQAKMVKCIVVTVMKRDAKFSTTKILDKM